MNKDIADRIESAGAPKLHVVNVIINEPVEDEAIVYARQWCADHSKTFMVLSGGMGTHKSGAAVWAMAQERRRYNAQFPTQELMLFVSAPQLRLAFGFDDNAERFMRKLKRISLLVIDDLGTEYADKSGFFFQGLNDLINDRYANIKRTIVTTNLAPADFVAQYPRIADRMRECGSFFNIAGGSKRSQ